MKKPSFGSMRHGKRRGVQKKNHFNFTEKSLKSVAFIAKMDSMCGVKSFISASQAPKGMKACWFCGLYHGERIGIDAIGARLSQKAIEIDLPSNPSLEYQRPSGDSPERFLTV